jgi:hypothetical protein
MPMRRLMLFPTIGWAILALSSSARAGLYHPDVLAQFDIDADGYAVPLSLSSFKSLVGVANEADLIKGAPETESHKKLVHAIEARRKKGNLSPPELVAQSAELLRLRFERDYIDEAIDLLRAIRPLPTGYEFLIQTHQAHAFMIRPNGRDVARAYEFEESAVKDYDFPKSIPGLTDLQVKWYHRLERDYYLLFLRHRQEEAARRLNAADQLDPIFASGTKSMRKPIRYVGESGRYEAGGLAASEMEKLPRDAVAIVQQMILWDPSDPRLWWQLGEVYNAQGDVKSAWAVFDSLLDFNTWKFAVPELKEHYRILKPAYQRQLEIDAQMAEMQAQADEEQKRFEDERRRLTAEEKRQRTIWVVAGLGLVLAFVGYWQTRELIRRYQSRRPNMSLFMDDDMRSKTEGARDPKNSTPK